MLNEKNKENGITKIVVALLVAVGLVVVIWVLLQRQMQSQYNLPINQTTSTPESSEITWLTYNKPEVRLALNYPSNYIVEDATSHAKKLNPLLLVNFVPKDNSKIETDSVFLTVYPKGNIMSTEGWVSQKTTSKPNTNVVGQTSYLYYNVANVLPSKVGLNMVTTYTQSFPGTTAKIYTTVIMSDKYVYLLAYTPGHVTDIYQQMLSSLTF